MSLIDRTAEKPSNKSLQCLESPEDSRVISATDRIFMTHRGGKIHVASKFQIESPHTLSEHH